MLNQEGLTVRKSKVSEAKGDMMPVLGVEIYPTGEILPSADKAKAVIAQTESVLRKGAATPKAMQRLLGRWVWLFLLRRPLLSVFRACYHLAALKTKRRVPLGEYVADELRGAVALLPLAKSTLNSPQAPLTMATDASLTGGGVMYAPATFAAGLELSDNRSSLVSNEKTGIVKDFVLAQQ
mmetsp:Transcript_3777/g.9853  ORF Transcript_3777/g.9853 Transcript_3777/m.9853 type:complete len:181 (+) Transcript_3777:3-545(+)